MTPTQSRKAHPVEISNPPRRKTPPPSVRPLASITPTMVYYFTSSAVEPPGFIYVGKDKAPPPPGRCKLATDAAQFHVDKLSSAHVYLRMREGQSWDALPDALLADLAQLTKANSIEGNKKDNVAVIYTPWSNLRKDGSMDVGQVSFKDARKVRRVLVAARENPIVNRLNRTRVEKRPDLKQLRDERLAELRRRDQAAAQTRRKEEARQAQEWKEKKWAKDHAYDDMFTEENMAGSSNRDRGADWEDDFM
ncbi:coiled-coil domain-containing protein 25 [Metarhizium guizhouense ARSEF 977]|uniref:Coiled-coil domain-containing protein 25 n=1 Tax=Metarhizium guizhouense (strain ARSEF 977) TaxID=1276136 RepID=A0A0B4H398_METGA|nr:coiled-coil domain-containing protein 25 [Metarhizium guizhouense ARSEF 977]